MQVSHATEWPLTVLTRRTLHLRCPGGPFALIHLSLLTRSGVLQHMPTGCGSWGALWFTGELASRASSWIEHQSCLPDLSRQ